MSKGQINSIKYEILNFSLFFREKYHIFAEKFVLIDYGTKGSDEKPKGISDVVTAGFSRIGNGQFSDYQGYRAREGEPIVEYSG